MKMHGIDIRELADVILARRRGQEIAQGLGFAADEQIQIVAAVSEVGRRIIQSNGHGSMSFSYVVTGSRSGIECVCLGLELQQEDLREDNGSCGEEGIDCIGRLMDELEVRGPGQDAAIVMRKWLRKG